MCKKLFCWLLVLAVMGLPLVVVNAICQEEKMYASSSGLIETIGAQEDVEMTMLLTCQDKHVAPWVETSGSNDQVVDISETNSWASLEDDTHETDWRATLGIVENDFYSVTSFCRSLLALKGRAAPGNTENCFAGNTFGGEPSTHVMLA